MKQSEYGAREREKSKGTKSGFIYAADLHYADKMLIRKMNAIKMNVNVESIYLSC